MPPKFGTSGLRGLADEMTEDLVADYVTACLAACDMGRGLYIARDLRASSPRIAAAVIAAARAAGVDCTDCGRVPTPALALAAMAAGAGSVMVTGSHIPADRNGLKFYTPRGEITKADEAAILSALTPGLSRPRPAALPPGRHFRDDRAGAGYVARYVTTFGPTALQGRRIGIYSHSAVGRDLLLRLFKGLGAEVTELGRAADFIPVDTEAVDAATRSQLRDWAAGAFDAILSTDGDGDRPLLADGSGAVIPGDILGQITAAYLGADTVVTTVSANTGVDLGGAFVRVLRSKIGSPYVIAAMEEAGTADGTRIIGYEPNGGFLLGFDATGPAGPLPRLMTRDAVLPLIVPLIAAGGGSLAERVAREPARFTATDRLQNVAPAQTQALITRLAADPGPLLAPLAEAQGTRDMTDGLRLGLASGRVLHLRASGNAPELRVYTEAETPTAARQLLEEVLEWLARSDPAGK